jgi:hypothetical protein
MSSDTFILTSDSTELGVDPKHSRDVCGDALDDPCTVRGWAEVYC